MNAPRTKPQQKVVPNSERLTVRRSGPAQAGKGRALGQSVVVFAGRVAAGPSSPPSAPGCSAPWRTTRAAGRVSFRRARCPRKL